MAEEAAKSVSDELGDMMGSFVEVKADDESTVDVENVDEKGDEEEKVEKEEESEAETEEGDAEEGEESEESEDEETPDERAEEIADLNAKIIRLESLVEASVKPIKTEDKADVSVEYKDIDFIGDSDVAGVVDTKEGLNKFANAVLKVATELVNKGTEKTLLAVPGLAIRQLDNATKLNKVVADFYRGNEDLVKYKGVVGAMVNKVLSEDPGLSMEKVLEKVADETRKALNLKEKAEGKTKSKPKTNPAFSKQKGKRTAGTQPKLKGLQKEIDELIE